MRVIDLRGLPCPEPFMTFVKKAYVMEPGEAKVIVDDPACFRLIVAYAPELDCEVVKTSTRDGVYEVVIRKVTGANGAGGETPGVAGSP
ncbi:MAG: sulfurtransferase TusA family protein [Thermoprotei archaeon]